MEENANSNTTPAPNRNFKDGMFRAYFKEPERFRQLCNCVLGTDFGPETPMEDVTLASALYLIRKNDIAFLVDGRLIIFTEHQSTPSPNVALRLLIYAANTYKARFDTLSTHDPRPLTIPRPYFFVFYNGVEKMPPTQTLRLSDLFEKWPGPNDPPFGLDLWVTIYNINTDVDPEILRRCEPLAHYETFVELVRKYQREHGLEKAVWIAVDECIKRGILTEFLKLHAKEILEMIKTEVTWDEAQEFYRKVGREEGMVEGMENERRKNAIAMKAKGMDTNSIAEITGLTIDDILRL
jgi:hypothetical protein